MCEEYQQILHGGAGYQNRFVIPASDFESEVAESGLKIDKHFDLFPYLSMWRTYMLRT